MSILTLPPRVVGTVSREDIARWFPHFAMHAEGTTYEMYLSPPVDAKRNYVEVTVFYREPGDNKWKVRVDATFDYEVALEGREPGPKEIRILQWGPAWKDFYEGGLDGLKDKVAEQERLRREGVPL